MSLVAYYSSDESEDEGEEDQCSTEKKETNKLQHRSLFSSLPEPKHSKLITGEDSLQNILLNKDGLNNTKGSVKIGIPSLSDFKDDEDIRSPSKKLKPSSKGSGLFSILPPPKHISTKEVKRSLIPNSVSKVTHKPEPKVVINKSVNHTSNLTNSIGLNYADSDESDNDESTDFFKLNHSPKSYDRVNDCVNFEKSDNTVEGEPILNQEVEVNSSANTEHSDTGFISVSKDNLELDEEAIQKLCGRKKGKVPLQLIDVLGEEIMPDSKEWMVKQLTEEKPLKSHSHRKKDGPSTQQKRKHQITYLAYQAKEQELELQNQWANNRLSKKQTQSKYGF